MKKVLMLALALTASSSLAAPFVFPAAWTSNKPSEVKTGGTYRLAMAGENKTYNPFVARESGQFTPEGATGLTAPSGGLMIYDLAKADFIPYMAESVSVAGDQMTYTVKLRSGMKWSNGQAIDADDFVTAYTIHRDKDVGSNGYSNWYPNDKPITVKKINDLTLQVKFPFVDATAESFLAGFYPEPTSVFMPVYKAKGAEGIKNMWTVSTNPKDLVTSGPFMVASYTQGERAVLKRNPYFGEWNKDSAGKALPYLDTINYTIVKDTNASLAQYLAGNTDAYRPNNRDRLAQVKAAINAGKLKAELKANAGNSASSFFMFFNMDDGSTVKGKLFRNNQFRQAMSQLINREAIVDLVYGGLASPAYSSVYPIFPEWQATGTDKYKFNPSAAAKKLAALGYTKKNKDGYLVDAKGNVLEFTVASYAESPIPGQILNIFKDDAKKVGVKVNVSLIAFNQLTAMTDATDGFKPRKFDAVVIGLAGGDIPLPVGGVNVVPCSKLPDGGNLHMFNQTNKCLFPWETQIVNLYNNAKKTLSKEKRIGYARQIQNIETEQLPYIQLVSNNIHYSWLDKVQGEMPANLLKISDLYGSARYPELTWIK